MRRVVDTNVPVAANGRNTDASIECRLAAIEFLSLLIEEGVTVLDIAGAIQAEYHRHLNPSGQPGVGDRFYLMVLNSAPSRVERIELPIDPATGDYADFPNDPALNSFDQSDRKFAAAARRHNVPVSNAIDRGWLDHNADLQKNGVVVEFVCGCDRSRWFLPP